MKRKTELKRWTLRQAEREFTAHRDTLSRRLDKLGEKPDTDGTFSTQQILRAAYGDEAGEKLRKLRADADLAEMARDERAGALLPTDAVELVWQEALSEMKSVITAADIPADLKRTLLQQLKPIPTRDYTDAKNTAGAQPSDE